MRVSKGVQFAILRGAVSEWVAMRYGKQAKRRFSCGNEFGPKVSKQNFFESMEAQVPHRFRGSDGIVFVDTVEIWHSG